MTPPTLSIFAVLFLSSTMALANEPAVHAAPKNPSSAAASLRTPAFEKNRIRYKGAVADESAVMNAFISYGQSWRSQSVAISSSGLIPDDGPGYAFAPKAKNTNTLLPAISLPWVAEQYGDLEELNWNNTVTGSSNNATGNIGNIAARSFVKLSKKNGYSPFKVVDAGMAYPGYTWKQLQPGTQPWEVMVKAVKKVAAINEANGKQTRWLGVGWTHGVFSPTDDFDYYAQLKEMVAAFDKLALNEGNGGTHKPLHYFTDMFGGVSDMNVQAANTLRQLDFAVAHASRVHLVNPRYPYPIAEGDNVHNTGMGYAQYGEVEGLAKYVTLVEGKTWEPFRILSGKIEGSTISLKVSQPMSGFGKPEIDVSQIEQASQYGFRVKANGADIPIKKVSFPNATTIALELAPPKKLAAKLEVSYAWYGPGAPFGTHVGVWGNIKRKGPPSVLFQGKTIDLWLCNYLGTVERTPSK
ncbi:hypothetical protein HBDW_04870 [Herbaspirillum sp. DW155]|uniref:hypothetical protein n=1 Tax=Herbaspirillum sp. DW155 TaxID=3095609 RepID=UPI00308E0B14|nr:hypothetical protein HBDW_04870 [Herbaspirillum sp. DW155]